MYELSPASREALDEFCKGLSDSQADLFRSAVGRVCADPSGRREPQHRYTRPFRTAQRYVPGLDRKQKAWEFKTNHARGLFIVDDELRVIVFVPVRGQRFFAPRDAPWPH